MRFSAYFSDRIFFAAVNAAMIALLTGLFYITDVRGIFIFFFDMLILMALMIELFWDYFRKKRYYKAFWETFDNLDDKTLVTEIVKCPRFLDGSMFYQVVHHTNKYMSDRLAETERELKEYREYVEMWIHEIKTPITSANLMVENDKNTTTMRIGTELQNIEHYVEQALYYARSTSVEKDFRIEKVLLKDLVNQALKGYSKQIIRAGGHVSFENLDINVPADRKWCCFIIGQIIANAVKYRKENLQLFFSGGIYSGGEYLSVVDNGIGIVEADLPYVFDKGFTGTHGREYTKSTGIGLYLCQNLCHKMNMKITVESEEEKGTTVKLFFPKQDMFME